MAPPSKAGFTDLCTNIRIEQPNSDSNEFKGKVVLRAVLKSDGTTTTLELDEVLASRRGKLCWRERGDFSKKLYRGTLPRLVRHLDWVDTDNDGEPDKRMYTVMHAQMQLPDGNFVESSVNLDDHIAVGDVIAAGQTDDKSATLPQGLVPFKLPRARTVVLCFDGTSNKFDDTNTNVVHFMRALQKCDPDAQQVYYQDGIGTYTAPGAWGGAMATVSKMADMAFGSTLESHVMSGYKFLMNTYKRGDKVTLLGFSRGAYTARVLMGMISKVGLLPAWNEEHIPFAFECYKNSNTAEGLHACEVFRETFAEKIKIHFVGVWDTVNSTGVLSPDSCPWIDPDESIVKFFRHAVALDERRFKFRPSVLTTPSTKLTRSGIPRVKQVWFAGDHGNVGGGNVPDLAHTAIANIPLRWMIDQTFECKTDIIFHPLPLKGPVGITAPPPGLLSRAIGRIGAWFWAAEEAMLPPQQYQRLYIAFDHATGAFNRATDALLHLEEQDRHCQIHDSAAGATWGLIEWIPLRGQTVPVQLNGLGDTSARDSAWHWNRGKGREVPVFEGLRIHASVWRMARPGDALPGKESPALDKATKTAGGNTSDSGYSSGSDAGEREAIARVIKGKPYLCKARFGEKSLLDALKDEEIVRMIEWEH